QICTKSPLKITNKILKLPLNPFTSAAVQISSIYRNKLFRLIVAESIVYSSCKTQICTKTPLKITNKTLKLPFNPFTSTAVEISSIYRNKLFRLIVAESIVYSSFKTQICTKTPFKITNKNLKLPLIHSHPLLLRYHLYIETSC